MLYLVIFLHLYRVCYCNQSTSGITLNTGNKIVQVRLDNIQYIICKFYETVNDDLVEEIQTYNL